jgi:hypothetical protein
MVGDEMTIGENGGGIFIEFGRGGRRDRGGEGEEAEQVRRGEESSEWQETTWWIPALRSSAQQEKRGDCLTHSSVTAFPLSLSVSTVFLFFLSRLFLLLAYGHSGDFK